MHVCCDGPHGSRCPIPPEGVVACKRCLGRGGNWRSIDVREESVKEGFIKRAISYCRSCYDVIRAVGCSERRAIVFCSSASLKVSSPCDSYTRWQQLTKLIFPLFLFKDHHILEVFSAQNFCFEFVNICAQKSRVWNLFTSTVAALLSTTITRATTVTTRD